MATKLGHEIQVGDWIIDRYSEEDSPIPVEVLEVRHHTDPDSDRWLPGGVGLIVSNQPDWAWDISVGPFNEVELATTEQRELVEDNLRRARVAEATERVADNLAEVNRRLADK
jgi:hypothetical protein